MGDAEAFEALATAMSRSLWRSAWLLTGDREAAEELVQTALTQLLAALGGGLACRSP